MMKARKTTGRRWRGGLVLAAVALAVLAAASVRAEDGADSKAADGTAAGTVEGVGAAGDRKQQNVHQLSRDYPPRPSIAPSWSIPYEPLGLAAPGPLYLGERNVLVSLDFLGEDRLLFTFRVPGLLHREPGESEQSDERHIHAVVLALPSGAVQAEATWIVHDRSRYLWGLDDGHFLLRDQDGLLEGDATLKLRPLLKFPGRLLTVDLDPGQKYLVTNSREPVAVKKSATAGDSAATSTAGPGNSAGNGSGNDSGDDSGDGSTDSHGKARDLVVRVLRRDSGGVLLVDRVGEPVRLPHNEDGYLDEMRSERNGWDVEMNYFGGGHKTVGTVLSTCTPDLDFVSETVMLASGCSDQGDDALVALSADGEKLWTDLTTDRQVWPLLRIAPGGMRFVRETLYVTHAVGIFAPLGDDDIRGQWVQVLNDANGEVAFESPASPIFDGGGNVAISPSGRRVAVINGGAIQVFELPAAPALAGSAAGRGRP